jgi:cytochrome o ubiquinol oxidase subunit 2
MMRVLSTARALLAPRARRRGRVCALSLMSLGLSGCQLAVLNPQGPIGAADRQILINSVVIMLVVVLPTIVATLGVAWWFRASNPRARYSPEWVYSGRIELVTWSIPVLVILFLGGLAWTGSHDLDPARPLPSSGDPLEVQVVSLDWKWLFIYPSEKIASVNQLVVPAGVPIHFALTSASVMTAFFIPQLGSMIYTMNGMRTQLYLQADHEGTYHGLASQFSGDGFSTMGFDVRAVSADEFRQWVGTAAATGPGLDSQSYRQLEQQSQNVVPFTYRDVEGGLFEAILLQKLPPGPGPESSQPLPDMTTNQK